MLLSPAYRWLALAAICAGLSGCAWQFPWHRAPGPAAQVVENPMFVQVTDREFLWNTLTDTIDDYFRITHEERVRLIGGVPTPGRIDTYPTPGSTLLEPWRGDSASGYERLHATLQTIRRHAEVRVMPAEGGYLIEVIVNKELEDLARPENSTAGTALQRHDATNVRVEGPVQQDPNSLGWIPLGRDATLEQVILLQLRAKLTNAGDVTTRIPLEVNQGAHVDSE
jgi:hypothetical protein